MKVLTVSLILIQVITCTGVAEVFDKMSSSQSTVVRENTEQNILTEENAENNLNMRIPRLDFQASGYTGDSSQKMNGANIKTEIEKKEDFININYLAQIDSAALSLIEGEPNISVELQETTQQSIEKYNQILEKELVKTIEKQLKEKTEAISCQSLAAQKLLLKSLPDSKEQAPQKSTLSSSSSLSSQTILEQTRNDDEIIDIQTISDDDIDIEVVYENIRPKENIIKNGSQPSSSTATNNKVSNPKREDAITSVQTDSPLKRRRGSAQSEEFLYNWRFSRLSDIRRPFLRSPKNIIECKIANEEEVNTYDKEKLNELEARISEWSCRRLSMWEVVLKLSQEDAENKHLTFLAIHNNREQFNNKLSFFVGYYDGFFKDLAEYMKEHFITVASIKSGPNTVKLPKWKGTLGDIYAIETLDAESIKKCTQKSRRIINTDSFSSKLQTILRIPEVYNDLSSMPSRIFKNTIDKPATPQDRIFTLKETLILKYLYGLARLEKPCDSSEYCNDIYRKICDAFEERIDDCELTHKSYSLVEIYRQVYNTLVLFYRKLPSYYTKPDNLHKVQRIMGKNIIVNQEYIKCEAMITDKINNKKERFPVVQEPKYTSVLNHWNAFPTTPRHYHIQFVDNSLQIIRRVCLPFYFYPNNSKTHFAHTISDIIKYLKKVYNLESTGQVYALKINPDTSECTLLSDGDAQKKTIYNLITEKVSVVFYYIKEELIDEHFTLSVLKGLNNDKNSKGHIPLFFSPFMRLAMQLGPYTKENEHKLLKVDELKESYVMPNIYTYSEPAKECAIKRRTYTEIEKYYSEFYIDPNISENTELCPTLASSIEKAENMPDQDMLVWYARVSKSPEEYMHYSFDIEPIPKSMPGRRTMMNILDKIEKRSKKTGFLTYGIYLTHRAYDDVSVIFFCDDLAKKIGENYTTHIAAQVCVKLVGIKTIDPAKATLCVHNELFKVLFNSKECFSS